MALIQDVGFAAGVRMTRLSLRRLGFRRTVSVFGSLPTPLSSRQVDQGSASDWAARIADSAGRPYGATCLDRSVLLWFLMRQHGLNGRIRIGVAFDDVRQLDGHAWVELDGSVVNDDPDIADHFAVFDEDPAALAFS